MEKINPSSSDRGQRLDAWLAGIRPELSRARWQDLIRAGRVQVSGAAAKPNHRLAGAETIVIDIPAPVPVEVRAQAIPLDILFEDADMLAVNKPAGLVVHPAPGHADGTLVNALLHHCSNLGGIGGELRPGIVHRLDRDTSGVLVVAKHDQALLALARQFKGREVRKEYLALVQGVPAPRAGLIDTLIGRSSHDRKKMSVQTARGRRAITRYEVTEAFADTALVRVMIETGRTHQIRVHLASLGHPVLGDRQYGHHHVRAPAQPPRQMLHAARLALRHPLSGSPLEFEAPLPEDFRQALSQLRAGTAPKEKRGCP